MIKPEDTTGTTQSGPVGPPSSQSSETVPPFLFTREGVDKPTEAHPEKLFSLFAQALFSAPTGGESNSAPPLPGVARPEPLSNVTFGVRALVVGFTETELHALCPMLRNLKFDTMATPNADEALDVLAASSIALLVIDWDLPATHALVLAQTVRKRSVEQPLILGLATQLTETLKVSARGTGFDRFYEKPLSRDHLIECLKGNGVTPLGARSHP